MKLCKNCKYCESEMELKDVDGSFCFHKYYSVIDPIAGRIYNTRCFVARRFESACGPDGKLFELDNDKTIKEIEDL